MDTHKSKMEITQSVIFLNRIKEVNESSNKFAETMLMLGPEQMTKLYYVGKDRDFIQLTHDHLVNNVTALSLILSNPSNIVRPKSMYQAYDLHMFDQQFSPASLRVASETVSNKSDADKLTDFCKSMGYSFDHEDVRNDEVEKRNTPNKALPVYPGHFISLCRNFTDKHQSEIFPLPIDHARSLESFLLQQSHFQHTQDELDALLDIGLAFFTKFPSIQNLVVDDKVLFRIRALLIFLFKKLGCAGQRMIVGKITNDASGSALKIFKSATLHLLKYRVSKSISNPSESTMLCKVFPNLAEYPHSL